MTQGRPAGSKVSVLYTGWLDVLDAINLLSFRYAKTMPQWPHEYTVRCHDTNQAYMLLWTAIRDHGTQETFTGTKKPSVKLYLYPGDGWRYWFENHNPMTSRIINRNRIEDADKLRKAGIIS